MQFEPTEIPEVVLIRPKEFGDPRGYFFESWEERKFAAAGHDSDELSLRLLDLVVQAARKARQSRDRRGVRRRGRHPA